MFKNIECLVNKECYQKDYKVLTELLKSTSNLALATRYYVLLS